MQFNDKDKRRPPGSGSLSQILPGGLSWQSSVYSLTFDEFQNSVGGLGKDFGSMNMDELLKNICYAEETQATSTRGAAAFQEAGGYKMQSQGSLTLPRTLSQKTVDEVWRELLRDSSGGDMAQGSAASSLQPPPVPQTQQREPTLGEITLEEFLVRAGVVKEDITRSQRSITNNDNNTSTNIFFGDYLGANSNSNMGFSLGFPPTNQANASVMVPQPVFNNSTSSMLVSEVKPSYTPHMQLGSNNEFGNKMGVMAEGIANIGKSVANGGPRPMPAAVGLAANGMTINAAASPVKPSSSDGFLKNNSDLSSLSPVPYAFKGTSRRNNGIEKVVERRQRRMIKNRESAARSRARKQAYTMELEAEVAKLKEQNQELQKKKDELLEMQKIQVLEIINLQSESKKRCLRRTQTGPW